MFKTQYRLLDLGKDAGLDRYMLQMQSRFFWIPFPWSKISTISDLESAKQYLVVLREDGEVIA